MATDARPGPDEADGQRRGSTGAPSGSSSPRPDGLTPISGPENRLASLVRLATLRPSPPTSSTEVPVVGVHLPDHRPAEEHLRRYRAAVRSYATVPLAYPAVVTMPLHLDLLASGDIPVRPLGMVYLGFDVTATGSLNTTAPWDVAAWVRGTRHTKAGLEFDTMAEVTGQGPQGQDVTWRTRSVLLMRSRSASGPDASAAPDVPDVEGPWEQQTRLAVAEDTGRTFARLNGDFNPIHLHKLSAKPFGFPRAIAHGWWTLGRILALLDLDDPAAPARATISFRKPVLCPSTPLLLSRHDGGQTEFALVRDDDPSTLLVGGRAGDS